MEGSYPLDDANAVGKVGGGRSEVADPSVHDFARAVVA